MTHYIKNGVIITQGTVIDVDGATIFSPKEADYLANGWEVYVAAEASVPTEEETAIANQASAMSATSVSKYQALMDVFTLTVPSGATEDEYGNIELPFKFGYRWTPVLNGTTITYELVEDEDAIGKESNPIIFAEGVALIPNAFYSYNGSLYVYMGKSGTATTWSDVSSYMGEW